MGLSIGSDHQRSFRFGIVVLQHPEGDRTRTQHRRDRAAGDPTHLWSEVNFSGGPFQCGEDLCSCDGHAGGIEREYTALLKEDKVKYQKIVDSKWIDDREKMYFAQASADYLGERALMIETIHAWVGDLLRLKAGGEGLEFPEHEEVMKKAVEDEDLDVLLRRVAAMEELRRLLETNVVEALALEVSLMNTFGKITA